MNDVQESNVIAEALAKEALRAHRARKALAAAPELAEHLRALMLPTDGRTETTARDVTREDRSTFGSPAIGASPTPLLTAVADAADELLVDLSTWSTFWALELQKPAPAVSMWRIADGGERGFHANVTPTAARLQVSAISSWLLWNDEEIAVHEVAGEYQDGVSELVWRLRSASGLTSPKRGSGIREKALLECDRCHELEMRVEYFGGAIAGAELRDEDLASNVQGIEVYCAHCGWKPETSAAKLLKWLSLGNAERVTPAEAAVLRATVARPHEPLDSDAWLGKESALIASLGDRISRACADVGLDHHAACDLIAVDGGRCVCPWCQHPRVLRG